MSDLIALNDFLIVLGGIASGFLNVVAAGGSLITLPILIFLGLPPTVANATNRVGILFQNIMGVSVYSRRNSLNFKYAKKYILPALVGSLCGSYIAVYLDDDMMRKVIGVVMLLMGATMFFNPKKWLQGSGSIPSSHLSLKELITFFAVGAYGGFIQAGIGVFLLAALVLVGGLNLVESNPIKIFIALFYTGLALIIFNYHDLVDWRTGFTMAAGSVMGGWIGARVSLKWGVNFIRWTLLVVIVMSSSKLLGLW